MLTTKEEIVKKIQEISKTIYQYQTSINKLQEEGIRLNGRLDLLADLDAANGSKAGVNEASKEEVEATVAETTGL